MNPQTTPVTPRQIAAANQRLVTAMRRHRDAKKQYDRTERELKTARAEVRRLIDLLSRAAASPLPGPEAPCSSCGAVLGLGARCLQCQAFGTLMTPIRLARENGTQL